MRCYRIAASILIVSFGTACPPALAEGPDITMTWVEKYLTYSQDPSGELHLTDVHMLAEIIFDGDRNFDAIRASLYEDESDAPLATYAGSDKRAFTNGYFYTRKTRSFDSLAELEAAHPSSAEYRWHVEGPQGSFELPPIRIGGPDRKLQVPEPSPIRLSQNGQQVEDVNAIDQDLDLVMSWNPFVIGSKLGDTEWDDLVFVLVSDCRGAVIFTGGAPGTDDDFVRFDENSSVVPAGTLQPGREYTAFISQVNYVDHNESHGITQLAANSFATELPIRTTAGEDGGVACEGKRRPAQYLWTRKTRGTQMETWPTVADYW
jgi:hypothetical protein